jgi:hypothetical protein
MLSNSPEGTTPVFEWRLIHDGIGKTPNVRTNASSWIYKGDLWVSCGSGSGQGKSSEVWRFDMNKKIWSKVSVVGEPPSSRDGQSGTYIGEGKFVIFGGQGFAEPNKKLGRESDGMKTQTHWKRDVLNDLWLFDCEASKWTPIYPNGLSFPMGRRGHTAIYVNTVFGSHSLLNGNEDSHNHHGDFNHKSSLNSSKFESSVPENTLLVYGGAGIELSKYTEQLYNDVWLYSFEANTWRRYETKGIEPTPVTNHKAERIGDNMIVVGGITNIKPVTPSFTPSEPSNVSDFMIFNLATSTWSFAPLYDTFGKVIRINMHGFSLVPDTTIWTDVVPSNGHGHHHGSSKERLTAPLESQKLFIYGGKHIVDSKQASTTKTAKLAHDFDEPVLVLNFKDSTLIPLSVRDGSQPEARYSQLGFCGMTVETFQEIFAFNATERKDQAQPSRSGHHHASQLSQVATHHRNSSPNPYIPKDIPCEEIVMFIFGGCNEDSGGYCDPALFALVKKNIPMSSATHHQSSGMNNILPESNRPGSPDFFNDSLGSWSPGRSHSFGSTVIEDRQVDHSSTSIWINLQNKQNLANYSNDMPPIQSTKDPSNWEEMKLSLTPSHSERIFDVTKRQPSRQKLAASGQRNVLSRNSSRQLNNISTPPLLMLNDVDFAYRSVSSHNQGSPRSPWHLPSVDLNGPRPTTSSMRLSTTGFMENNFPSRASTAPERSSRLTSSCFSTYNKGLTGTSPPVGDVDPEILEEERKKRIQLIKSTLKPVVRSQTKINARESYHKLFPKPYG